MGNASLFVPETSAIADREQSSGRLLSTDPWNRFFREIARLLRVINVSGIGRGVVVTDPDGNATVTDLSFDTPTFDASKYTSDSGTWDVEAADVVTWASTDLGRLNFVMWHLAGTTVTGTPNELRAELPNGIQAKKAVSTLCYLSDNGTPTTGLATVAASGITLTITRLDGAAFSASANATDVRGELFLEGF